MKKILSFLILSVIATLPMLANGANTYVPKSPKNYISGPKGGCYYWNKNGNKTYVSRSLCR